MWVRRPRQQPQSWHRRTLFKLLRKSGGGQHRQLNRRVLHLLASLWLLQRGRWSVRVRSLQHPRHSPLQLQLPVLPAKPLASAVVMTLWMVLVLALWQLASALPHVLSCVVAP